MGKPARARILPLAVGSRFALGSVWIGKWGPGLAVLGGLSVMALGVAMLDACSTGPLNVPDECTDACSEHEYCVAKVLNDASVKTECRKLPSFCKDAPDVCECIRTTKGPPHYHCMPSDAGVVLASP